MHYIGCLSGQSSGVMNIFIPKEEGKEGGNIFCILEVFVL